MDRVILARLPLEVWSRVEPEVVEVWALLEIERSNLDTLVDIWRDFRVISWDAHSNSRGDLEEVEDFWTGEPGRWKTGILGASRFPDRRFSTSVLELA